MRKKDKIKKEAVQGAASALANLSRKDAEEVNRSAAASLLKKQIRAARARGATWMEISEVLKASGVDVSIKTLARALDVDKKEKTQKPDKNKAKAVAAPVKDSPVSTPSGAMPPPAVPGGFQIKPDRGADL